MKIGFLGCGNMASAFIDGFISNRIVKAEDIRICELMIEKTQRFCDLGARVCEDAKKLGEECDIVFVCVKPQQADEPLKKLKQGLKPDSLIVTILAGKRISYFKTMLGENVRVIRLMPNTPLMLGYGAVAMSSDEKVGKDELNTVKTMIECLGKVEIIDEDLMDAIVAVNGSSPAYFYKFVKAMTDWAVAQGIDYDVALGLSVQSMLGSAYMLKKNDKSPEQLIKDVSSPGGTTLAALYEFDKAGFDKIISDAMDACRKRSHELSASK